MSKPNSEMEEMLELAWGIIANASGGDWKKEQPDWRGAAEKWRDQYHSFLREKREMGLELTEGMPEQSGLEQADRALNLPNDQAKITRIQVLADIISAGVLKTITVMEQHMPDGFPHSDLFVSRRRRLDRVPNDEKVRTQFKQHGPSTFELKVLDHSRAGKISSGEQS